MVYRHSRDGEQTSGVEHPLSPPALPQSTCSLSLPWSMTLSPTPTPSLSPSPGVYPLSPFPAVPTLSSISWSSRPFSLPQSTHPMPSLPVSGHLPPWSGCTARDSQTCLSDMEQAGVVRGELGLSGCLSTPGLMLPLRPWRGVTIVTRRGSTLPLHCPRPGSQFLSGTKGTGNLQCTWQVALVHGLPGTPPHEMYGHVVTICILW